MLNLKKLEKIAFLAFDNALRLHNDAIALYVDGRYPSAFYLSILSQEEFGKMHIVNDFVWHSRIEGRMIGFEDKWLELLYKHPHKQYSFLRNSPLNNDWSQKGMAVMEGVFKGVLEVKKQNSVYVGLSRNKGKIDSKGKIKYPYQITKKVAQEQITKINDYIVVTSIGVRYDQFNLDNREVEYIMKNKRFIKEHFSNWKYMSRSAKARIKSIQKFFKEIIISV